MAYASYFEMAGDVFDVASDINHARGNISTKQQRQNKRLIRAGVNAGKAAEQSIADGIVAANEGKFGFANAGEMAGVWFGMVFGLATLPVVAADGPLPFADAAWAFTTFRITRSSMEIGRSIGESIDEALA
jgi:hypothetical protein